MGLGAGIFGAVIGGILGGHWGAVIGGSLGLMLSGNKRSGNGPFSGDQNGAGAEEKQAAFNAALCLLFRCLGKIAKSDGRVSESEAEYVRALLHNITDDSYIRKVLISEFNAGRDSDQNFFTMVKELNEALEICEAYRFKIEAVKIFCALVTVDRHVDRNELQMLNIAGSVLGCPETVEYFFAGYDHDKDTYAKQNSSDCTLAQAYEILGINESASDDMVKKAFRSKAKENHPDKAQAAGLSAAMIEQAKQKFQKISNAYDMICQARGIN